MGNSKRRCYKRITGIITCSNEHKTGVCTCVDSSLRTVNKRAHGMIRLYLKKTYALKFMQFDTYEITKPS